MPKKAAGDQTHFELFAEQYPASAQYLIDKVPGQLVEIQAMANRGFRDLDTPFRMTTAFDHLREIGRTRTEAIKEVGQMFGAKRSKVLEVVGAEPDDDDGDEARRDLLFSVIRSELQDTIFHRTAVGAPKAEMRWLEEQLQVGDYIRVNALLARALVSLVEDTPTSRTKLRRQLCKLQMKGDHEQAFSRLIGYAVELRRVSAGQRDQALKDLALLGPIGQLISKYLHARLEADLEIALLRHRVLDVARTDRVEDLLNEIVEMSEAIVDRCWETFNDPRAKRRKVDGAYDWESAYSKYRERAHPEDTWDMGVRNELENFALAHPKIARIRVPKPPRETEAQARDREMRAAFQARRKAGEPAEAIIRDLAKEHFRSIDRVRRVVYSTG